MITEQGQSLASGKIPAHKNMLLHFAQTAESLKANNQTSKYSDFKKVPLLHDATRDLGYFLYEILAVGDLMREAYVTKDIESLERRFALLKIKTTNFAEALSILVNSNNPEPATDAFEYCIFDIDALLQEIVQRIQLQVRSKPVKVTYISSPCPVFVFSNRFTIKQIVTELCANAAKYTNHGRVAIILYKDKNRIRFTITDTGIGMTAEQIKTLLTQSEPARLKQTGRRSKTPLSGIKMVQKHLKTLDGAMIISSKFGEGTIAEVELPVEYTDHPSSPEYR